MKDFLNDNFLLESGSAEKLYHDFAKDLPLIDYHSHLPPLEIAENRRFENLTQVWIEGDHYKWRAMRQLGTEERVITGTGSDWEKFQAWANTVPYAIRNPLYHWTHLELKRYFGIDELLSPETAEGIFHQANKMLASEDFSARGLIRSMNAEVITTTDDPLDDLLSHQQVNAEEKSFKMLPTFRPDGVINIEKDEFSNYLLAMGKSTHLTISDWESLKSAIKSRMEYFHCHGCRLSDHGLRHAYGYKYDEVKVDQILKDRISGKLPSEKDVRQYKSAIMHFLGTCYAEKNWTMQLHLGPLRDANKAMLEAIGYDAGVDSIGDFQHAEQMANFLNKLNVEGSLPKTILYNSNPADNEVFATMAGNFSEEGVKGKVQYGAAWWFLDQKDGITRQIESLSNMGLLSCSIGMLTDSRSFLSFPRHEYFRRILCNILGNDIEQGYLPNDMNWIGKIVQDVCYYNAKNYLEFPHLVDQEPAKVVSINGDK